MNQEEKEGVMYYQKYRKEKIKDMFVNVFFGIVIGVGLTLLFFSWMAS